MKVTEYRRRTRKTWAETFFGSAYLSYYRSKIDNIAQSIDKTLDTLKKHLFYGNGKAVERSGHESFEDLTLTRGQKDLLHAVLGIATEAGELLEAIRPLLSDDDEVLDTINIDEEMGDVYYYMMRIHDALETTPEATMNRNLNKLLERYEGGEFSSENALNRDTDQEREALES